MDLQFHGANCLSINFKGTRLVIDDNLAELGAKSILKAEDVALYTGSHKPVTARIMFDGPGEYEVADVSVIGIAARAHMDEDDKKSATMFKLIVGPVGGNGYTVDPVGALKLIKEIEPKLVVPSHYADKALKFEVPQQELGNALKELAMEPKETVAKLRLKPGELSDVTQLIVLEKS
jgi:L-ascorbate metabolism protein UlaG (beta-lactamase superfamily)